MKNDRRKLEIPMPAAMLCKTSMCRSCRETCRTIGEHKTKYARVVESDESVRESEWKALLTDIMKITCRKRHEFIKSQHFSAQIIPMPQAMKIQDAQAAMENNGKLEKILAWNLTKVKNKRRRQDSGKIKADGDELDINCLDKFLVLEGETKAFTGKPDARARRNSKPEAASSSQGSWAG